MTIHAVGDEYVKWEGYKDAATGETHIGLSYGKLCSSVKAGNRILLADGSISIVVDEVSLLSHSAYHRSLGLGLATAGVLTFAPVFCHTSLLPTKAHGRLGMLQTDPALSELPLCRFCYRLWTAPR